MTNQIISDERLMPIYQAADRLGLSHWTLRLWVQHGKIASHKLGGRRLIPISEIERLIAESRIPARKSSETLASAA